MVRFQREDGTEDRAAVHGGFVQVDGEHVTVLAPVAELASEIDLDRARHALEQSSARIAELGGSAPQTGTGEPAVGNQELADAEETRRRAELRIEVAGG